MGKGEHLPGHPDPHDGSADCPAQCKKETVRTSLQFRNNQETTKYKISTYFSNKTHKNKTSIIS